MELHEPGRIGEEEILARHIRLAEVLEGKRPLDWFDLETFIYDASCPTIPGKRVALWSIVGEKYFHRELYGPHWPLVAITVGLALVGVVLWGSLSGSMLPFVLRRVGADPATSSAPFVATLVDVTGLIIYFSIALLIMRGAML